MSKHIFKLRMTATYRPPENEIATLEVDVLADNKWTALDLGITTPGFLVFVYSIFTCQHTFLRTNGTERELGFASSHGSIEVEASEDWFLEKIDVQFDVRLSAGEAGEDDISYIVSRMKQCPVSKNLPGGLETRTRVGFEHE